MAVYDVACTLSSLLRQTLRSRQRHETSNMHHRRSDAVAVRPRQHVYDSAALTLDALFPWMLPRTRSVHSVNTEMYLR